MADFLDEKVKEIDARLKELKPLVGEYARLSAAREALAGVNGSAAEPAAAPRKRRASTGSTARKSSGRKRARRGGTRANQALELVRGKPGITIPELAAAMSIQPNYLYRVLPGLADEGHIRRDGRGWHPAA